MIFEFEVEGGNFSQAGTASSEIKKILNQLDVDFKLVKRVVVAVYEAEVNVVAHAHKGKIVADIDTGGISIIVEDEGPGIADIDKAMEAGFSTASQKVREMGFGAGMGLPNIKKNVDKLMITSKINKGTKLKMEVSFLNN
jgi:anti-sigma regulatory factor (Ser/Thr protein kinase)